MKGSKNLDVVKCAYSALDADDLQTFLEFCAPDIEWLYPPTKEIPYGGRWMGHEGVTRFLATHDKAEDILEWTHSEMITQGDRVVVLGHYRGKAKPAGSVWEADFVNVLTVRDWTIQRFEAFFDTAAAVAARTQQLVRS